MSYQDGFAHWGVIKVIFGELAGEPRPLTGSLEGQMFVSPTVGVNRFMGLLSVSCMPVFAWSWVNSKHLSFNLQICFHLRGNENMIFMFSSTREHQDLKLAFRDPLAR